MILRFYHGWGFDAGFWRHVAALLPQFMHEYCDRGYFGQPSWPPPADKPLIAVTHSFGTMLALREAMPGCRGLIAINGFDCFTARDDLPATPPRMLDRMLDRFEADPGAVLADFRKRCGDRTAVAGFVANVLHSDLVALRDWDCRDQTDALGLPVLSLEGGDDPILPPAMRQLAFGCEAQLQREELAGGGHLLPLADPGFCAERIAAFAEQLQ